VHTAQAEDKIFHVINHMQLIFKNQNLFLKIGLYFGGFKTSL
jgi:hypothetical protein